MPGTVIIGAQWGDEGKGKITDLIADRMDIVVRYAGGNNAGHTVVCGEDEFKLHLIPSGILYPHITPVIGNGVVINPRFLLEEMDGLEARGKSTGGLKISCNAHMIMPYHMAFDRLGELSLGNSKLGTTHRGIGPAYADKADRLGLRVQDLLDEKIFRAKVATALERKNAILSKAFGQDTFDTDEIVQEYMGYAERLRDHIEDTSLLLYEALCAQKKVLFEGAQGTLLDIDHGTYPFVTSSSPTVGGAFTGTGVGPRFVSRIIGVAKAYVTRVGYGPFPTEQCNEFGEAMGIRGAEFGTTTGRKRRCGWLDVVLLRYAVRTNGLSSIALTKLDVLGEFERLKICVGYSFGGKVYHDFPPHQTIFHKCEPEYLEVPGWHCDISGITDKNDLPSEALRYIEFVEQAAGVPVEVISVGPKRSQTIWASEELEPPFVEDGPHLYKEEYDPSAGLNLEEGGK